MGGDLEMNISGGILVRGIHELGRLTCFSVHASTEMTVWRDVLSRHQAFERFGRYLRER